MDRSAIRQGDDKERLTSENGGYCHPMPDRRSIDLLTNGWCDIITPYMRVMSGLVGISLIVFGWGPMITPDAAAYQQPVFAAVRRFASMQAWGLGFWVPALLLVLAAASGRALMYVWGSMLGSFALSLWGVFVVQEWIRHDAVFTTGGLALYMLAVTITTGLAFSPKQLAEEDQPVVRLDSQKIIPLRPVDGDIASNM